MSLDTATVARVARLARLAMNKERQEQLAPQLSRMIDFVEQLNEVDTTGVEPLANVSEITLSLREDKVTDGNKAQDVLKNAPEQAEGFFVVPKVVE